MPKISHFAFKQEYSGLTKKLINDVSVIGVSVEGVQEAITAKALWDTGATGSAITPRIAQTLGLGR